MNTIKISFTRFDHTESCILTNNPPILGLDAIGQAWKISQIKVKR